MTTDGNAAGPETEKYGCFGCKPSCLQCFNTIRWHVLWQCVFTFFEGFVVNGAINVVLAALEKRYSLSSSESGLIASSNDIGAILCVTVVGYFGERRHKPVLMSSGILLMALGCLVFSLPQFVGSRYQYTMSTGDQNNDTSNMCNIFSNQSNACQTTSGDHAVDRNDVYYALLLIGNMLLGIGASPMFTIGLSYIDENCKQKMSSFYISWTFCSAAVGVAVGYVVGGQSLSWFVDIDKVDPTSVPLTPMDPQWVGAWWIAPLIAMTGLLAVIIPILGYPRRLPTYDEIQKSRPLEAHGGGDDITAQANFGKGWKDFPKAIFLLLKNPTYIFICLGAAFESLTIGGMASFGTKLMQEKFNVDLALAGTIMGIITIPGSGGGMLLGGYLVKRFDMKCRAIIRTCAGFMLLALCFGPFMLAHCPSDSIAGIDTPYTTDTAAFGLVADCNTDCGCTTQGFQPVCGGGVVYFSPCYAGCETSSKKDGVEVYSECACIANATHGNSTLGSKSRGNNSRSSDIKAGLCTGKCVWMYVFCALFLVVMVLTFATMSPGTIALFRCVPDNQRSVALGVNLLFVRLVGTTPGPILLGAIIDSTCTVWQDTCGVQGSCWVYDRYNMGVRIVLWYMVLKTCGFLSFVTASIVYKAPPPAVVKDVPLPSLTSPLAAKSERFDINKKMYGGEGFSHL